MTMTGIVAVLVKAHAGADLPGQVADLAVSVQEGAA